MALAMAASICRLMDSLIKAGYSGVMFGCKSACVVSFLCGSDSITAPSNSDRFHRRYHTIAVCPQNECRGSCFCYDKYFDTAGLGPSGAMAAWHAETRPSPRRSLGATLGGI